jgi:hypothetical protein
MANNLVVLTDAEESRVVGENKGVRNRIRQLQRETVPDTFSIPAEDQLTCVSTFSNVKEVFDGS